MTNVFIVHGSYGSPEGNWFPWMKIELEKLGCKVFVPKFPTPEGQNLKNWTEILQQYKTELNEDAIVVGHSVAVSFLLNVIEKLNHPIKAAFFVSGWIGLLNNPKFDPIIKTFAEREFNWSKIKKNCKKFYAFHSDNDPYVPMEKGKFLAKKLGVKVILIKGGGHLNAEFGYTKFPLLLEKIKKEL